MAVMTSQQRADVTAEYMRQLKAFGINSTSGYVKPELRAAIDAVDQWISDNQAAFNSNLPLPYRTAASSGEKTFLFFMVLSARRALGL